MLYTNNKKCPKIWAIINSDEEIRGLYSSKEKAKYNLDIYDLDPENRKRYKIRTFSYDKEVEF